jgi:hypothetical protein
VNLTDTVSTTDSERFVPDRHMWMCCLASIRVGHDPPGVSILATICYRP